MDIGNNKLKCIVICTSMPTFLFSGLVLCHILPTLVLCPSHLVPVIKSISSPHTFVATLDEFTSGATDYASTTQLELGLVIGHVNHTVVKTMVGLGVHTIVADTKPRRLHSHWKLQHVVIHHQAFGGVTSAAHKFWIIHQQRRPLVWKNVSSLLEVRDAYTIYDDSVWCYSFRRKPIESPVHPLRSVNVGTTSSPVFHIGGLLPIEGIRNYHIVGPARGSRESSWGYRKLTTKEIYSCIDIDFERAANGLLQWDMLSPSKLIPSRSWLGAIAHVVKIGADSAPIVKRARVHDIPTLKLGVEFRQLFTALENISADQKAVKSDDAVTNVRLWFHYLFDEGGSLFQPLFSKVLASYSMEAIDVALDVLRGFLLSRWKRNLRRDFCSFLMQSHQTWRLLRCNTVISNMVHWDHGGYSWTKDGRSKYNHLWNVRAHGSSYMWLKGQDALQRAFKSSWWEWRAGSSPFFWRWPKWYRNFIQHGIAFPLFREPPRHMKPQRRVTDTKRHKLVCAKLRTVIDKGYLGPGPIKSLTAFFDVPKGEDDIRMVYDGTVNGFNDSIEVPTFGMPTLKAHLRAMGPGYHMVDADVGECFLNFHLHPSLRPYVGVDLTHFQTNKDGPRLKWLCWHRAGMGLKSSPYQACQGMMVAEQIILGNPSNKHNPFRWDEVRVNLPGSDNYDPSLPWISKIRASDGCIAADVFIYVDDLRITGLTKKEAWEACHRVSTILAWLGIQDATRKRRDSSRTAGAWAGSVIYTTKDSVYVLVTKEKWTKARSLLADLRSKLRGSNIIKRKLLQRIRGFLNYVALTYPILMSHLMGFHLTIDGWRGGRDEDGWRICDFSHTTEDEDLEGELDSLDDGPEEVTAKPRLILDVESLMELMSSELPPLRQIRSKVVSHVYYGFGDASGSAFGATLLDADVTYFEYGQWSTEMSEESSNWRELNNLVESIESWVRSHDMKGSQLFVFTDNMTAECAFWKGTSKSRKLFNLILKLKRISLTWDLDLHVIHISGKRMQKQGTDGLSRGEHGVGVMSGMHMLRFVPLHLSPCSRESQLKPWIDHITAGLNFSWTNHHDWFYRVQNQDGNFIWDVEPAAGDVAYELLDKARLKRPTSMHVLLIPRIWTGLWRRILTRRSDCYIKIDWDELWPTNIHFEPLLIFISIPFRIDHPFGTRKQGLLEQFQGVLQKCKLPETSFLQKGNLLRKFLSLAGTLPSLQ